MSGNIIGAQGVVVGRWGSHSKIDESVLRRFADLAVGFQDGSWMVVASCPPRRIPKTNGCTMKCVGALLKL